MARPKKSDEDRRDSDMKIPLSEAEKEAIQQAAELDGERPVTWSREKLLSIARRVLKRAGES